MFRKFLLFRLRLYQQSISTVNYTQVYNLLASLTSLSMILRIRQEVMTLSPCNLVGGYERFSEI